MIKNRLIKRSADDARLETVKEAVAKYYQGEDLVHLVRKLLSYDGSCLPDFLNWESMADFDEVAEQVGLPYSAVARAVKAGVFDYDKDDVFVLEDGEQFPHGYTWGEMTKLCERYEDDVALAVMSTGTDLEPGLQEVLDGLE